MSECVGRILVLPDLQNNPRALEIAKDRPVLIIKQFFAHDAPISVM